MPIRSDRALLLKRTPYGESSLVVHVLSPKFGRVQLMAKGAYRPTSRVYCVLDWFDTLELEWNSQPGRDLDLVRRGDRGQRRSAIPADPRRYGLAWSAIELAELAAQPGQADPALYLALEAGLDGIATAEDPAFELTLFEARFLEALGLYPALSSCASCGRAAPPLKGPVDGPAGAPPRVPFSAGVGGRLCGNCAREARSAGRRVGTLPLHVVDSAAMLIGERSAPASEIANGGPPDRVDPVDRERVRDLFERFLAFHLERHPRLLRRNLQRRPQARTAAGSPSSQPNPSGPR